MSYGKKRRKELGAISVIICLAAIVLDIICVFALKDSSSMHRWIWLPLISIASGLVFSISIGATVEEGSYLGIIMGSIGILWGLIRGIILVVAYFQNSSGFFAIVGAIFLCMFMFIFNMSPFLICGGVVLGMSKSSSGKSEGEGEYGYAPASDDPPHTPKNVYEPSHAPVRGSLTDYFRAYACAPQGGMYFWEESPYMSSQYGSHSKYIIKGTIGISSQSVETFNVKDYDMEHHLASVTREVGDYFDEITERYHDDYPDDDTAFSVDISLRLIVV